MSKPTLLAQGAKAQEYIKIAVNEALSIVAPTLGPNAQTTLMYRTYGRGPRNVDDGFWSLEAHTPKNIFVRLGYEFFKEATQKTNRKVGDGTSGTTVFGANLYNNLSAKVQSSALGYGNNAVGGDIKLKSQILSEANQVKEAIRKASKEIKTIKDLEKIAAVSLGEENETSKLIAKMAWEVGVDGFIDVVEGYKGEIEHEVVKGMRFPAKVCGKAFVNKPERFEMVVEDCPVFITNHKLDNDLVTRVLVKNLGENKVLLMAPDFSNEVLNNIVLSWKNGVFVWPVKIPSLRTEVMEDVATYMGATLCDKNKGHKLTDVKADSLGYFEKFIVKDSETKEDAIMLGGNGEKSGAVKERIKILKGQLEETKEPQFKMLMERRISSLASAGGIIRVGSPTDAESLPFKLKIEDVVFACRAALRSGYVKGGGLCLKEIAEKLPKTSLLKEALMAPYKQIQANAGGVLEIGKDVVDPTDAIYYTVEFGTSVVASLITVHNLEVEEPELQLGEGETAIAREIRGAVLAWKKKEGLLSESEKAMYQDANPFTQDELTTLDNG